MATPLQPPGDIWADDDNARRYDAYAREYPGYRETSRELVVLALPAADPATAGARVLDLACGTGATAREILAVLGPGGRVTGVDRSAAMLAVAAASTSDPRVTWVQAPAETAGQHVSGPFGAAVCNSAIWQTDVAATLRAVRAVLQAGAPFAFNVPAGFLGEAGWEVKPERYPSLAGEMRVIAARDYGWSPPGPVPGRSRPSLTRDSVLSSVLAAGFRAERVTDISYQSSAEAERAWLTVPVFTRDLLRGLPYADRMRVLDRACAGLGPVPAETSRWVVFLARAV